MSRYIFAVLILAFCCTRFLFLDFFPIFFFCDEAFVGVEAVKLVENRFRHQDGTLLPMYWDKAQGRWVPQLSIYLSLIPTLLFPRSVEALRAVTGLISLLGTLLACWGLQRAKGLSSFAWLPLIYVTICPTLILHNRLAFETANSISGMFAAMGFYAAYRAGSDRSLLGFIAAAFFVFYSHWSGTIVISGLSALLLLSDASYHLSRARARPRMALLACCAILLLGIPFVRFLLANPAGIYQQLSILNAEVSHTKALSEILSPIVTRYFAAFDPRYWFTYVYAPDQIRHLWIDRPFVTSTLAIPFVIGLGSVLLSLRSSLSRLLLFGLLCGPLPVVLVDMHVQRVFYVVAPLILIASIGSTKIFAGLGKFDRLYKCAPVLLVLAAIYETAVLTKEMRNSPFWYREYTLGGMQWGAQTLFREAIPEVLAAYPKSQIVPSGEWANGSDAFPRFFLTKEQQHRLIGRPFDLLHPEPDELLDQNTIFILSPPERVRIESSGLFQPIRPLREIPYPDGSLGFTFSYLEYLPNREDLLAPERLERQKPQSAVLSIWGRKATATFSRLDLGTIQEAFDSDYFTVARGLRANPFVLELVYEEPVASRSILLSLFPMRAKAELILRDRVGGIVWQGHAQSDFAKRSEDAVISFAPTDGFPQFYSLDLKIFAVEERRDRSHIHVRELRID